MSRTKTIQSFALASVALRDDYTKFILSRQAKGKDPAVIASVSFAVVYRLVKALLKE